MNLKTKHAVNTCYSIFLNGPIIINSTQKLISNTECMCRDDF